MHRYFTTAMRHTYVAAVSLGGLLVSGSEGGDDLVCDAKFPSFVDNAEQASKAVSFAWFWKSAGLFQTQFDHLQF